MASVGELMVMVSADTSALDTALDKAGAAILTILRRQYIAEGSPHGATPEGFDAWMAERESLIVPKFDVGDPVVPVFPAPDTSIAGLMKRLNLPRKGPPGSADDCELCHPELAGEDGGP